MVLSSLPSIKRISKVVALQADGSAMYTLQALWTMARERADVTVVLLNNRSYAILNIELARVGAGTPLPWFPFIQSMQ